MATKKTALKVKAALPVKPKTDEDVEKTLKKILRALNGFTREQIERVASELQDYAAYSLEEDEPVSTPSTSTISSTPSFKKPAPRKSAKAKSAKTTKAKPAKSASSPSRCKDSKRKASKASEGAEQDATGASDDKLLNLLKEKAPYRVD